MTSGGDVQAGAAEGVAEGLGDAGVDRDRAEDLTVELLAADTAFGGAVDAALLYSERAKAAGITINVKRVPNDGYWSNVWNKLPWCACYWGGRTIED